MLWSFLLQNCPSSKKCKSSNSLVNIIFFAVDFYLFVGLIFTLTRNSLIELGSRYFKYPSINAVKLVSNSFIDCLPEERTQHVDISVNNNDTLNISVILIDFYFIYIWPICTLFKSKNLVDSFCGFSLSIDIVNTTENTLKTVNTLGNSWIDRVIMTDVTLLKSFHLERIEIDVDWEQIKREVTNINILTQSIFFEELFANDSPFRPKTGVVSFDSFISVSLD